VTVTRKSAVVVGAGIGGITAATHLARAGLRVTVVEKNSKPGGRCGSFTRDGHRFDTGPTLFVMPLQYEAEFRALGVSLHERLDLARVDPTYTLVFDDGSRLGLTSDMAAMRAQLEEVEPGSFDGLQRYLREGGRHYRLVVDNVVNRQFRRASDLLSAQLLAVALRTKPLRNHYRNLGAYFHAPRLRDAFSFQDLYVGLTPFDAPATFSMLPYSELSHGVWYPTGGMHSVVETLVGLALEAGVEFVFNAPVSRIITTRSRATGVRLRDGSQLEGDVVLANADLPYVYQHLLPEDGMAKALARKQFSCSAISFFWGLDRRYESLGPHTLFLADDSFDNFKAIVDELTLPSNPSLYVHAPVRLDPAMAPRGHDTLTAIVPVGHLREDGAQDWGALQDAARQHVFRRLATLGITDIRQHIKFEEAYTPLSWAMHHNLMKGATHGLSHRLTQMAFFRPSNRHRVYRNLYFAGASTHPGTGVPMAMVSGRLAAQRIAAELR
jgi:phytoene desaturase